MTQEFAQNDICNYSGDVFILLSFFFNKKPSKWASTRKFLILRVLLYNSNTKSFLRVFHEF